MKRNLLHRTLSGGVRRLVIRDLRRAFRQVCWAGPLPDIPPDVPLVLYANHHNFYDGYLIWYLVHEVLSRPPLTWMADWKKFPFFAAQGALPFPPDDAQQRMATVRQTAAQFREDPNTALFYFPEAELRPPETGIGTFPTASFAKLDRIFPPHYWWPVAIHITWWGHALPTALLMGGTLRKQSDGQEQHHLAELLHTLQSAVPEETHTLLEGRKSPHENWDLSFTAPFFSRLLR